MTPQIPILSVTELSGLLKSHMEDHFPLVAVRGEVSNVSQTANGHLFLTLKDSQAQLRAVLWRDTARNLGVHVSGRRYTHIGLRVGLPALIAAGAVVICL